MILTADSLPYDRLEKIYLESFPPEERRPWANILGREEIKLLGIKTGDDVVGFFTLWDFGEFCYVEHFAIDDCYRGAGIGGKALAALKDRVGHKPIVVEVERKDAGLAAVRRIGFYQRNGFHPYSDYDYIQPSYGPGLAPVPLMLMASRHIDPEAIAACLHKNVYNQQA